jgi:ATP-dependent 26S proteasome regulatory subunit
VAEFLQRIPEAVRNHVLVVAMTNRIDMIDPAILRRGRFDHVIEVGMASTSEIESLLKKLLDALPQSADINLTALATGLSGRPLSDATFVVREGARLAARAGKAAVDNESLEAALASTPARNTERESKRSIGFS